MEKEQGLNAKIIGFTKPIFNETIACKNCTDNNLLELLALKKPEKLIVCAESDEELPADSIDLLIAKNPEAKAIGEFEKNAFKALKSNGICILLAPAKDQKSAAKELNNAGFGIEAIESESTQNEPAIIKARKP